MVTLLWRQRNENWHLATLFPGEKRKKKKRAQKGGGETLGSIFCLFFTIPSKEKEQNLKARAETKKSLPRQTKMRARILKENGRQETGFFKKKTLGLKRILPKLVEEYNSV